MMRLLFLLWLTVPAVVTAQTLVLEDVRLIDGTGHAAIDHASILIQNGKIVQVATQPGTKWPVRAQVLVLSGKTVMPGLINGHGHLGLTEKGVASPDGYTDANISRQLHQYERYGVTTVMSLGMNKDLLYRLIEEQKTGEVTGAAILTADRGIGVPNGVPPVQVGPDQVYRPGTVEEARQAVREMAEREPSLLKIWVDTNLGKLPAPNPAIYTAVIKEAHRHHLRVAAHVFYLEDAKRLLNAGVDILAHSVRDHALDAETIALLKKRNVYYIPTLQLEESFYIYADHPNWMDTPFFREAAGPQLWAALNASTYKAKVDSDPATVVHRAAFQMALENLKRAYDAGVRIGFGTDSGANPYRIQGFAEHRELQLYVAAGLTAGQAISCATKANAEMLQISNRTGTVAAGKDADLLILDDDPIANIQNSKKIHLVINNGRVVKPN